jgi:hypothetical protein
MAQAPYPLSSLIRAPADAAAALARQMRREWRALPVHQLSIGRPKTDGLAIRPRDLRPANPLTGARLLTGEFVFGGERVEVGLGGDPWRRALPSRRFAAALHSFDWMRDLIAAGEPGQREALRLWLEWRAVFGRYNAFAWAGETLERRVFNLACSAAALAPLVSEAEGAIFVADLARQARHLRGEPDAPGRDAERAAAAALVGAALDGKAGAALLGRALPLLERLLPETVLRDGVHVSRSPERGLELLFDLIALDDALSQRGLQIPVEVSRAVDRLSSATRFFTLGDGCLPAFQGGESGSRERIAAALALDATGGAPEKSAHYGGYHRLEARGLQIIADAGEVRGASPCVQPGALTVVCEGHRLIAGSAWSALVGEGRGGGRLARTGGRIMPRARRRLAGRGGDVGRTPGRPRRGLDRGLARRLALAGLRLHAPALSRHRLRRAQGRGHPDPRRTAARRPGSVRHPLPPGARRRRPARRRRQERAAAAGRTRPRLAAPRRLRRHGAQPRRRLRGRRAPGRAGAVAGRPHQPDRRRPGALETVARRGLMPPFPDGT